MKAIEHGTFLLIWILPTENSREKPISMGHLISAVWSFPTGMGGQIREPSIVQVSHKMLMAIKTFK